MQTSHKPYPSDPHESLISIAGVVKSADPTTDVEVDVGDPCDEVDAVNLEAWLKECLLSSSQQEKEDFMSALPGTHCWSCTRKAGASCRNGQKIATPTTSCEGNGCCQVERKRCNLVGPLCKILVPEFGLQAIDNYNGTVGGVQPSAETAKGIAFSCMCSRFEKIKAAFKKANSDKEVVSAGSLWQLCCSVRSAVAHAARYFAANEEEAPRVFSYAEFFDPALAAHGSRYLTHDEQDSERTKLATKAERTLQAHEMRAEGTAFCMSVLRQTFRSLALTMLHQVAKRVSVKIEDVVLAMDADATWKNPYPNNKYFAIVAYVAHKFGFTICAEVGLISAEKAAADLTKRMCAIVREWMSVEVEHVCVSSEKLAGLVMKVRSAVHNAAKHCGRVLTAQCMDDPSMGTYMLVTGSPDTMLPHAKWVQQTLPLLNHTALPVSDVLFVTGGSGPHTKDIMRLKGAHIKNKEDQPTEGTYFCTGKYFVSGPSILVAPAEKKNVPSNSAALISKAKVNV